MGVLNAVRIIVYRFHEKGLEIFLVNSDMEFDPDVWKFPKAQMEKLKKSQNFPNCIELDPVEDPDGNAIQAVAFEGDWHDIPSLRGMLKHDVRLVKSTIKEMLPGIEKGTFFAVKEALKKVLPDEYKALKELKDILLDRNLVKHI